MKKNQETTGYSFKSIGNTTSALRLPQPVFGVKAFFGHEIFNFLKANCEKIPIVFANIRV